MGSEEKAVLTVFAGFMAILVLCGICIGGLNFAGSYTRLASAENVIHNYEWFFDAKGAVDARVAQIKAHREILAAETDDKELRQLRIDLAGMQQSCRDLVARYNANASKATRSVFQSHNLPEYLNAEVCE
jgi:hypothetical protein